MTGDSEGTCPSELERQYMEAFAEWDESEDARFWDATVADGLDDEEGWTS
ncbi:hypothetical protein [Streptomyces sp. CB03238]|nr:hypothetical protein [Streptomyces sp. CB03238]